MDGFGVPSRRMRTERVTTMYGQFESWSGDLITGQLLRFLAHTRNEIAMLRAFIRPGDHVLDIGAHVGTFAIPLARFAGPAGRVVAFEASPDNFALLQKNVAINDLTHRVETHLGVVSDHRGTCAMRRDPGRNSGMWYFVPSGGEDATFATIHLDEWLAGRPDLRRIDLLKVDAEGAELSVLRCCAGAIEAHRPALYLEVNATALHRLGVTPSELGAFLAERGYRMFRNTGERNSSNDRFRIARIGSLEEGGDFFDVLAFHPADVRCRQAEDLSCNPTPRSAGTADGDRVWGS